MSFYVIIRGPLGSGKSTIARKLQERLKDARIFLVDDIVDSVLEKYGHTPENGFISQENFFKANEIIAREAEKLLNEGTPVIFDGNFYWKSQVDDLIKRLNFKHEVFTLKAPLDVCIQRDSEREQGFGKDAATVVFQKSTQFSCGKEIDATKPVNQCIDEIISLSPVN